eukprot:TRINITY_DN9629_c0_g1_i4.p1 TRINITY_DN9629_c0_g1~~TRINITY_DN9629_c0_g1_i4.p1  ORF type:complete len:345 (+),score=51.43 TRINITY_DN9629_c0_g1_i4:146-1180(+)
MAKRSLEDALSLEESGEAVLFASPVYVSSCFEKDWQEVCMSQQPPDQDLQEMLHNILQDDDQVQVKEEVKEEIRSEEEPPCLLSNYLQGGVLEGYTEIVDDNTAFAYCSPAERQSSSQKSWQADESNVLIPQSPVGQKDAGSKQGNKSCKKSGGNSTRSCKKRLVWTDDLHYRFITAVHQLGVNNAVPKNILQLMNIKGMTRENVASHLQKYRLYLKKLAGVAQNQSLPDNVAEEVQRKAVEEFHKKYYSNAKSNIQEAVACQMKKQICFQGESSGISALVYQQPSLLLCSEMGQQSLLALQQANQYQFQTGGINTAAGVQVVPSDFWSQQQGFVKGPTPDLLQ